jgi:hypothetical protein
LRWRDSSGERAKPATFAVVWRQAFESSKELQEWTIGKKTPVVDRQIIRLGIVSDFQDRQDTLLDVEGFGSLRGWS